MAFSLKVMVVDDTITYRMIMKKVAESVPGVRVTATASNGKLALDKLSSQMASKSEDCPDAVLLDVEMPVMDGLTTLREIRKRFPHIAVVMVSALSRSNANIIMECLNAGALDFVTKPLESNVERAKSALRRDLEPILTIIVKEDPSSLEESGGVEGVAEKKGDRGPVSPSDGKVLSRPPPLFRSPPMPPRGPLPAMKAKPFVGEVGRGLPVVGMPAVGRDSAMAAFPRPGLVLVGSSTGGPAALTKLMGTLGKALPVPMLIVQHMPPVFTASLAAQLTRTSGFTVNEAQDGLELLPGSITLAQGGRHMTLLNENNVYKVALNDGPKVNECRPAVDVLFMSVMASFSGHVLAVVLTGMGRDGANGVDALKRLGRTFCITQDQKSCVVYGMPRSVDEKGLSDLSLPLGEIGPRIYAICTGSGGD